LRIGLYEHISSGGLALETLPSNLLCEGFAMLRCLASDFKSAGHDVTVLLDERLAKFDNMLEANPIVKISSKEQIEEYILNSHGILDAFYLIAPESNRILYSLVEKVESSRFVSLNSYSKAIAEVTDKVKLYRHLSKLKMNTPKTIVFDIESAPHKVVDVIEEVMGFPVIFKPNSGAGCSGLSIVRNRNHISDAIFKISKEYSKGIFIVQEFIEGTTASVSLIATEKGVLPISLNMQRVTLENPSGFSSYDGGEVPLDNPLKEQAFALAKKLVESFVGLRGYIGVDLVLTGTSVYILEINPRLTTSYVGLRKVVNFNIAQAIVDSVLKKELPVSVQNSGYALFLKKDFSCLKPNCLEEICSMGTVVSPPFPIDEAGTAFGLIETYGATREEAVRELKDVKAKIKKITCLGEK
jgi:predicted ATP-grasp superfamily ATP-dependent carboligase